MQKFGFSNTTDYQDFLEDVERVIEPHDAVGVDSQKLTVSISQHLLDLYQEIEAARVNRNGWVI